MIYADDKLVELIKKLTSISEKLIIEFFPAIKISKDIAEDQVIISNGLSYIYIEHLDSIFHLSTFDQMNQEQSFCIEINTEDNVIDEKVVIKQFENKLVDYFNSISVGILKLNYKNIYKKLNDLAKNYKGQYIEVCQYDFCLEKLNIEIVSTEKKYLIELEFRNYNDLNGSISFNPLGSGILRTQNKLDSIEVIDVFLNKIVEYINKDLCEL